MATKKKRPLLNPDGSKAWQPSDGYIHDCAGCGRKDLDAELYDMDASCGYCGGYFCGVGESDEEDGPVCGGGVFSGVWSEGSPYKGRDVCPRCLYKAIEIGFVPHCGLDGIPDYVPFPQGTLNWNWKQMQYIIRRVI